MARVVCVLRYYFATLPVAPSSLLSYAAPGVSFTSRRECIVVAAHIHSLLIFMQLSAGLFDIRGMMDFQPRLVVPIRPPPQRQTRPHLHIQRCVPEWSASGDPENFYPSMLVVELKLEGASGSLKRHLRRLSWRDWAILEHQSRSVVVASTRAPPREQKHSLFGTGTMWAHFSSLVDDVIVSSYSVAN